MPETHLPCQPGILEPVPAVARYLVFHTAPGASPATQREALRQLAAQADGDAVVVGIGASLVAALGATVPGLRPFADFSAPGVPVPVTPSALWLWLRADAPGALFHRTRQWCAALAPAFVPGPVVDAFGHRVDAQGHGRDLTGYEDGTENPEGEAAEAAAFVRGAGAGLDGSSFVAVQQWTHDMAAFDAMTAQARDHVIGRRLDDNEELDDAPESAHVKRTAQESFEPEAFVLRRSMPWMGGLDGGLVFVAFGASLDAFEAQMRRMAGHDDGVVDAVFRISRPVTGACYWCPPLHDGRLDLRGLGL